MQRDVIPLFVARRDGPSNFPYLDLHVRTDGVGFAQGYVARGLRASLGTQSVALGVGGVVAEVGREKHVRRGFRGAMRIGVLRLTVCHVHPVTSV